MSPLGSTPRAALGRVVRERDKRDGGVDLKSVERNQVEARGPPPRDFPKT
jgi:hypothetical protein